MRTVALAALLLLAASLTIIFTFQTTVIFLLSGGIALLVGIALVLLGGPREVFILCGFAALLSALAVGFIGQAQWGLQGAMFAPVAWMLALYGGVAWVWYSTIQIPSGTVLMISHPNGVRLRKGPDRILPLLPTFERHVVTMPLYELSSSFNIEQINTKSLQDVKRISVEIYYKVSHPLKVLSGLPNRARLVEEMAEALDIDPNEAMLRTGFWERLLEKQINEDTDNFLRAVIYDQVNRAVECSTNRSQLASEVRERLCASVRRWGVEIHALDFETVELDPGQIKSNFRESAIRREVEDAERTARIEAQKIEMMGKAQAEVQAHAIGSWIRAIQEQSGGLEREEIEQIVLNALEEMNERNRRVELFTSSKHTYPDLKERALVQGN